MNCPTRTLALAVAPLLAACVSLSACAGCDDDTTPDGWTADATPSDTTESDDTANDGGRDADADDRVPQSVKFQLTNRANRPLTVATRADCRPDGWSMLSHDGALFLGDDTCQNCRCADVENGQCAACALPCPQAQPKTVEPGETVEWTWPGVAYVREQKDGGSCWRKTIFPTGEQVTAHFCWYEARSDDGTALGRECVEKTFEYGRRDRITHEVDDIAPRYPKTFVLENDTGSTIRYQQSRGCTQPAWFRSASDDVSLTTSCACRCRTLPVTRSCPTCRCASGTVKSLDPGESIDWEWPGTVYRSDKWLGKSCTTDDLPDPQKQLSLEFCWSTDSGPTGDGHTLQNPTCATETFRPSIRTTTIRHTVQ